MTTMFFVPCLFCWPSISWGLLLCEINGELYPAKFNGFLIGIFILLEFKKKREWRVTWVDYGGFSG